jgi:hypothetical protein
MATSSKNIGVWPPEPIHGPKQFFIGELSLLQAEALTVHDPGLARRTIKVMTIQVIVFLLGWIFTLGADFWIDYRFASHGPVSPIWYDPLFPHIVRMCSLNLVLQCVVVLPLTWWMFMINGAYGVRIFRQSKDMEIGKWSRPVLSVRVRGQSAWGKATYVVVINIAAEKKTVGQFLMSMGPKRDNTQPTYKLRNLDDANRLAEVLSDFLDVPLMRLI